MDVCRTCLKASDQLKNLFEDNILPYKIKVISLVQVAPNDNLPKTICDRCIENTHLLYDFRRIIILSNIKLLESTLAKQKDTFSKEKNEERTEEKLVEEELNKPYIKTAIEKANEKRLENGDELETNNSKPPTDKIHRYKNTICSICGVTVRRINLTKHVLIHTGPPVNCNECGKTCKNSESLRGHMVVHKQLQHECKICGKIYKYRGGLNNHKKRHALGDAKTVPCPICGKLFYDKQALQKHIRSHTGERPYPCKYCNKGFSSINARNTHIRQHTNEKPYACKLCPLAFPQKVSLRTHMKSKHPSEVEALQTL